MYWMRRQPDLRLSVVAKLAEALEIKPGAFAASILREQGRMESLRAQQRAKKYKKSAKNRVKSVARNVKSREKAEEIARRKRLRLTRSVL
jgi:regulator of protease activity HflC (stomatin/prohibitin superfamily)